MFYGLLANKTGRDSRLAKYRVVAAALIIISAAAADAMGQSGNDPLRFLAWVRDDVRAVPGALFQAPPNSAGLFAIAWGGVALRDDEWAESWQRWHRRELWRLVEELGDANAARPAALIIFVGSLLQEDARYQDAAFTSIEALVLANVATNALKLIAGRARPWQADDSHRWKPFSGKTSFPSGHATTAFALITPWLVYVPHPVTWSIAGIATATSISRITLRYHWPSDVVAGAAIGSTVGVWLARRHKRDTSTQFAEEKRVRLSTIVAPSTLGLRVRF